MEDDARWCPPSYKWVIIPLTIVISAISYWTYKPTIVMGNFHWFSGWMPSSAALGQPLRTAKTHSDSSLGETAAIPKPGCPGFGKAHEFPTKTLDFYCSNPFEIEVFIGTYMGKSWKIIYKWWMFNRHLWLPSGTNSDLKWLNIKHGCGWKTGRWMIRSWVCFYLVIRKMMRKYGKYVIELSGNIGKLWGIMGNALNA